MLLAAALAVGAALAGCTSMWGPKSVDITQARLQRALERQFPIERRVLERWRVRVLAPQLSFDASAQRVTTELTFEADDEPAGPRHRGRITIRHGVRFESSDATVRLTQPQILSVQADDAPLVFKGPLASAARAWVEQAFDDRVVYTVSAQDLQALLARGWRPGGISVIEQGLRVTLVAAGPS